MRDNQNKDSHDHPAQARTGNRIAEALRSGAYSSTDDVIDRALEVLHEQDEWLLASRQTIDAKIQRGIAELKRGEGIPEDELDAYLDRLKAQPERSSSSCAEPQKRIRVHLRTGRRTTFSSAEVASVSDCAAHACRP